MARTIKTHNSGEQAIVGQVYRIGRSLRTGHERWTVTHMYTGIRHAQDTDYETAYRTFCRLEGLPDDVCSECGETREMGALCVDCYVTAMFRQATV